MTFTDGRDKLTRKLAGRQTTILLIVVSTFILALSSVPDWVGYSVQDDRSSYAGTFFDVSDHAVHVAMIQYGMQGNWTYSFRFTSESHNSYSIRMFYIVLGQVNRILKIDPELLFQLARWFCGYGSLIALFTLCRRLFPSIQTIWVAFFLAVLGSGVGTIQLIMGWMPAEHIPIDLWLIDAYMLFSLALFPHFAFTLALSCVALLAFFDYLETGLMRKVLIVLVCAILVQFVNPIAFAIMDIVMSAAALVSWVKAGRINRLQLRALVLLAIAQVPLFTYNLMILTSDPIWRQFTTQNETPSPPPINYIAGFAFFWPLVLPGGIRAFRSRDYRLLSMLVWVASAFLLAYAPFDIQRRFLLGITIPLGILAANGLEGTLEWLSDRYTWIRSRINIISSFCVLIISFSTLVLYPIRAVYLQTRPEENYYPHSLDAAFEWIRKNTEADDLILGMKETGRLTAQKTGRRVYAGHPMETMMLPIKMESASAYYRGEIPPGWAAQSSIQWVIYGPYEKKITPSFHADKGVLELVYDSNEVKIYRVK